MKAYYLIVAVAAGIVAVAMAAQMQDWQTAPSQQDEVRRADAELEPEAEALFI